MLILTDKAEWREAGARELAVGLGSNPDFEGCKLCDCERTQHCSGRLAWKTGDGRASVDEMNLNGKWEALRVGPDFPGGSDGKASACSVGDLGSIPGLGRSPGEGNSNPLQHSCLENPMDRGAWWVTVHGVTKSRTQMSDFTSFSFFQSGGTPNCVWHSGPQDRQGLEPAQPVGWVQPLLPRAPFPGWGCWGVGAAGPRQGAQPRTSPCPQGAASVLRSPALRVHSALCFRPSRPFANINLLPITAAI